jgi:hypothetical protein
MGLASAPIFTLPATVAVYDSTGRCALNLNGPWLAIARGIAVLALALPAGPGCRHRGPRPDGAEEARARVLVARLGDDSWEKREAASQELAARGASALPAVKAALASRDPEVARRARTAFGAILANLRGESTELCIKDLLVCGPFPFEPDNARPLDLRLPPDDGIRVEAAYAAGDAVARWLRPFKLGDRGPVDFNAVLGRRDYASAYALASVHLAGRSPRKLLLLLGSDDAVQVRVNGKVVHTNPVARSLAPDQDSVEVTLEPGWNDILVKVVQFAGDWSVCLRLAEPDKAEPRGLTWDPTRGGRRLASPPPTPEKEPAPEGAP